MKQRFNEVLSTINPSRKEISKFGEVLTPEYIVDEMLSLTTITTETNILDMCSGIGNFSIRILHHLAETYQQFSANDFLTNHLTFNEIRAERIEKIRYIYGEAARIVDTPAQQIKNQSFDLVVSNPPYRRNLDIKILNSFIPNNNIKELLIIHPSRYLLDHKDNSSAKMYRTLKSILSSHLISAKFFNGNPVFRISIDRSIVIMHADMSKQINSIACNYFGNEYISPDIENITKFCNEWFSIVSPFFTQIKNWIKYNQSVLSQEKTKLLKHNAQIPIKGHNTQILLIRGSIMQQLFLMQIANVIGGHYDNSLAMYNDDFYTLIMKDWRKNIGIRKSLEKKVPMNTFCFDTENECDNFIHYLRTDFARFCLCIVKNSFNINSGELNYIPYMKTYIRPWTDKDLYEYFGISEETQEYITKYLPDYYGIRGK